MNNNYDHDRFNDWLRTAASLRRSTISNSLREADLLSRYYDAKTTPDGWLKWTARRLLRFHEAGGYVTKGFVAFLQTASVITASTARKKPAVSFTDADWKRLYTVVAKNDSLEAALLRVMLETGLRVGDLFRLRRDALTAAVGGETPFVVLEVKGGKKREVAFEGAPDAWMHLMRCWAHFRPSAKRLDRALCPNSHSDDAALYECAYGRIRRSLKRFAKEANVSGRIITHRVRRTVLVQALRSTKDIQEVQQLAGHTHFTTTMRYTDESRPQAVAKLQQHLRKRFLE